MTETLQFSRGIQVKRADVSEKGMFSGYASTFNASPDRAGDVIQRGAFRKSIEQYKSNGSMPGLLWAHDMREPVGRWLALSEDSKGLAAEGKLTLDVTRGRDAHALLKDGALSLSIGYFIRKDGSERNGTTLLLKDIELLEVSLVAVPANVGAKITSVKQWQTERDLQTWLHEAGLSRRDAACAAAAIWVRRGGESKELSQLSQAAALLRQRTAAITKGV